MNKISQYDVADGIRKALLDEGLSVGDVSNRPAFGAGVGFNCRMWAILVDLDNAELRLSRLFWPAPRISKRSTRSSAVISLADPGCLEELSGILRDDWWGISKNESCGQ